MTLPPLNNEVAAIPPPHNAGSTSKDSFSPSTVNPQANQKTDQVAIKTTLRATDMQADRARQQDRQTALAGSISKVVSSLEKLDRKIGDMKSQLTAIVKNYPPFPPGSDDRVRLLQSYASIRKEIEEITFPPPYKVMLDSQQSKTGNEWKQMLRDQANAIAAGDGAKGEPVVIAIPETPSPYDSDDHIDAAIAELDRTGGAIASQRAGLAAGVTALVQDPGFAQPGVGGEILDDLTENKARAVSMAAQQGLQAQKHGITGTFSPLLKVMT